MIHLRRIYGTKSDDFILNGEKSRKSMKCASAGNILNE